MRTAIRSALNRCECTILMSFALKYRKIILEVSKKDILEVIRNKVVLIPFSFISMQYSSKKGICSLEQMNIRSQSISYFLSSGKRLSKYFSAP